MNIYKEELCVRFESYGEQNALREALINKFNEKGIPFTDTTSVIEEIEGYPLELHQIRVDLYEFESVEHILECFTHLPENENYYSMEPLELNCVRFLSRRLQRDHAGLHPEHFSFAREMTPAEREDAVTLATYIDDMGRRGQPREPEYVRRAFNDEGVRQPSQYELDIERLRVIGTDHRALLDSYYEDHPALGIGLR